MFNKRLDNRRASLLLAGCLMAFALISLPVHAEPSADLQRLEKGQVVVQEKASTVKGVPAVEARILINNPPEKVWPVVTDPARLMESEPKVKKIRVLSKQNNRQDVEFNVLMTKLFPVFSYVLRQELKQPHEVTFNRLSGSFKHISGAWRLIPAENGKKTILSYTLQLDPGPLIPKSLLINAVKADLPTMMRNARKSIDKHAGR